MVDAVTVTEWVTLGADVILALGAVGAGAWAAYTFWQARKADVAKWQKQIFDDLFLSGHFDRIREKLEFEYEDGLARIVERSMQNRDAELSQADRELLLELDNFLNLVEYVLYLEEDRHQIDATDRQALLGYWVDLISSPSRSAIRYYASHYGYERISTLAAASCDTYLVLYGSLGEGQPKFMEFGLDKALQRVRQCEFDGELYDLGEYPGASFGHGKVKAVVYKVLDPEIFRVLDDYEEFDVNDPANSLFVRRCVHIEAVGDAWVYIYNGPKKDAKRIASGDWLNRSQKEVGSQS